MQCSWKAQGWPEPVTDHIDHPSLLLPRHSSVCSHSAVEHSAFWLSGGYLQGNVLSLVLGRRLSQCRQAAVVISRSSGWRILKGAQFPDFCSSLPPPSKESQVLLQGCLMAIPREKMIFQRTAALQTFSKEGVHFIIFWNSFHTLLVN